MDNAIAIIPVSYGDSNSFPLMHGYYGSGNIILQANIPTSGVKVLVAGY